MTSLENGSSAQPMTTLEIRELVLGVHLGCGADERVQPQPVSFSVAFRFTALPAGMMTDELSDSICYAQASDAIREVLQDQEFKLIEHLGFRIFQNLKTLAGDRAKVRLVVHKLQPPVEDLRGGSLFTLSEF